MILIKNTFENNEQNDILLRLTLIIFRLFGTNCFELVRICYAYSF